MLDLGAHEETGVSWSSTTGRPNASAQAQQACGLRGRIGGQRTDEVRGGWLAMIPHGAAVEVRERGHEAGAEAGFELEVAPTVDEVGQHGADVVGLGALLGDHGREVVGRTAIGARSACGGGSAPACGRQVRQERPDRVARVVVGLDHEVDLPGDPVVDVGAAERLHRHLLARGDLDHPRRRDGERGAADLHDEVGQTGDEARAAEGVAYDRRGDRDVVAAARAHGNTGSLE